MSEKYAEHSAIPRSEEHQRTGTTSPFILYDIFIFLKLTGIMNESGFECMEGIKKALTTDKRAIIEDPFLQCMEV